MQPIVLTQSRVSIFGAALAGGDFDVFQTKLLFLNLKMPTISLQDFSTLSAWSTTPGYPMSKYNLPCSS